jgi:outer membrane lipoprotein LolB
MKYRLHLLLLVLSATLLTACANLQNPAPASATIAHTYHEQIEMSGRLLVLYQQNEKAQSLPGSFEWKQDSNSTTVTLLTPTGQTAAIITMDRSGATLQQPKQETRFAPDLDSLMLDTLGWPLPIAGLRDWLQGFVAGKDGRRSAIAGGQDITLNTDGWKLRYATWQDDTPETMPKRLDLNRYTKEAGEVSLRIVITQWKAS